jgi:hypothetical protein
MTLTEFAARLRPTGDLWLRFAPKSELIGLLLQRIHDEGQDSADGAMTSGDAKTIVALADYYKVAASITFSEYKRSTLVLMINALPVSGYKVTPYVGESAKLPELFIRETAFFAEELADFSFTSQALILAAVHNADEQFTGDLSEHPQSSHRHLKAVLKFIMHFKDKEPLRYSSCPAGVVALLEADPELVPELVEFADARGFRMDGFDVELFHASKNSDAMVLSEGIL